MSKNEMITLPREVLEQALEALSNTGTQRGKQPSQFFAEGLSINALHTALDQPQPDPAPYLYYDPENGDTWTQEAVDEGFCVTDNLIPLYTK